MTDDLPVLILLPLLVGALAAPALGLRHGRSAFAVSLVCLLGYAALAIALFRAVHAGGTIRYALAGWEPPIGIELVIDPLSAFVVLVIAAISLPVLIFAGSAVPREMPGRESPFFGMLFVLLIGLNGIAITGDLFNLYVFFEITSLSCYALVALGSRRAPLSAFRYLVQGTLGASLYLIGLGFVYVLTGTLNMADVAVRLVGHEANPAYQAAIALMVTGVGLKMALFPMHLWLPDAYAHASTAATAFIAPLVTKVAAYVLIRLLYDVFEPAVVLGDLGLGQVVAWLSAAGIVVGSVMAIAQKDAKRMLAYSSVTQVAYIGLGIGLGNAVALIGALLHVVNHAVMKACLFMAVGGVTHATGATRIAQFAGLGRRMPWTTGAFSLAALAMVGIPPTSGFFSKWYLALGCVQAGQWVLLAVLVGSSLLTAGYVFRVLELLYARPFPDETRVRPLGAGMVLPIVVLALATLALGFANAYRVDALLAAAMPAGLEMTAR